MTLEEAQEALKFHSGRHSDIESPRWERGFLGSLRPYDGSLNLSAMSELEKCLETLAPVLRDGDTLSRELLTGLLYIIGAGQCWALHPEGMLRRNSLITPGDVDKLTRWLSGFSLALAMLVEGMEQETALDMLESVAP